jgi:hypothetical protein
MAWETFTALPHHVSATAPTDFEAALASRNGWMSYDFEPFSAGFLNVRDTGALVSFLNAGALRVVDIQAHQSDDDPAIWLARRI